MARQAVVVLIVVITFGILVPLYKGFGFLDPRIIAAYACLALLFVAPASAELASSSSIRRIALIVAWGWGVMLLILATAIVTVNVVNGRGGFLAPPAQFLAAVLTFSLSASTTIALLGAILARRFRPATVKNILRAAFFAVLLALAFGSRVLPERVMFSILDPFNTRRSLTHLAWQASVVFAAIAVLLLLVMLRSRNGPSFAKIRMAENPDEGGR